jgi:hypothetical protein
MTGTDMTEEARTVVTSPKSQRVSVDGHPFSIEIHRLEDEPAWTLEVVDFEGNNHVWDDRFESDKDACNAALKELESEGAFMRG